MTPRQWVLTTFSATLFLTSGTSCQKFATTPMPASLRTEMPVSTSADSKVQPAQTMPTSDAPPAGLYPSDEPIPDAEEHRASDRFADVPLQTHEGKTVQFVRDLVRDRIVVINLTYTRCRGSCPTTNARIMQLRRILGPEYGQRIAFLSISVEPEFDTPEVLAEFSARFRRNETPDLPPWIFLTGTPDDIEQLRYSLGLFEPDPELDADRTNHAGLLTYGNDRTNRWAATPSELDAEEIAKAILRITGETNNQRYAGLYTGHAAP